MELTELKLTQVAQKVITLFVLFAFCYIYYKIERYWKLPLNERVVKTLTRQRGKNKTF